MFEHVTDLNGRHEAVSAAVRLPNGPGASHSRGDSGESPAERVSAGCPLPQPVRKRGEEGREEVTKRFAFNRILALLAIIISAVKTPTKRRHCSTSLAILIRGVVTYILAYPGLWPRLHLSSCKAMSGREAWVRGYRCCYSIGALLLTLLLE